jgi:hypothetical protein
MPRRQSVSSPEMTRLADSHHESKVFLDKASSIISHSNSGIYSKKYLPTQGITDLNVFPVAAKP